MATAGADCKETQTTETAVAKTDEDNDDGNSMEAIQQKRRR